MANRFTAELVRLIDDEDGKAEVVGFIGDEEPSFRKHVSDASAPFSSFGSSLISGELRRELTSPPGDSPEYGLSAGIRGVARGFETGAKFVASVPKSLQFAAGAQEIARKIKILGDLESKGETDDPRAMISIRAEGLDNYKNRLKEELARDEQAQKIVASELAERLREVAQSGAKQIDIFDAIKTGQYARWAGESFGQGVATLAPLVLMGLVTRNPTLATSGVMGSAAALNFADALSERLQDDTFYGAPGVGRPSAVERAIGAEGRMTEKYVKEAPAVVGTAAAMTGVDFALGPIGQIVRSRLGRDAFKQSLQQMSASKAFKEVLKASAGGAIGEAANEFTQEFLLSVMNAALDDGDLVTAENARRWISAAAAGAVPGAALGGTARVFYSEPERIALASQEEKRQTADAVEKIMSPKTTVDEAIRTAQQELNRPNIVVETAADLVEERSDVDRLVSVGLDKEVAEKIASGQPLADDATIQKAAQAAPEIQFLDDNTVRIPFLEGIDTEPTTAPSGPIKPTRYWENVPERDKGLPEDVPWQQTTGRAVVETTGAPRHTEPVETTARTRYWEDVPEKDKGRPQDPMEGEAVTPAPPGPVQPTRYWENVPEQDKGAPIDTFGDKALEKAAENLRQAIKEDVKATFKKPSLEIQELAEAVNESRRRLGKEALRIAEADASMFKPDRAGEVSLAEMMSKAVGVNVRFVKLSDPMAFNGLYYKGNLYVSVDAPNAIPAVVGHEFFHRMEESAPDLYQELVKATTNYLQPSSVWYQKYNVEPGSLSPEEVRSEMLADLTGDAWLTPEYWNRVAVDLGSSRFMRVKQAILNLLDRVIGAFRSRGYGSNEFVKDVTRVRNHLAKMTAEYLRRQQQQKNQLSNDLQSHFTQKTEDIFSVDSDSETKIPQESKIPRAAEKYITDEESALLNKRDAEKLAEVWAMLPPAVETAEVALAGSAARGWYKESSKTLLGVFGPDAPRFVAVLAALSPRTSVENNLLMSLRLWVLWENAGRPIKTADQFVKKVLSDRAIPGFMSTTAPNVIRALTAENFDNFILSGPKVNSFYRNLMGNTIETTLDTWMASFFLFDQEFFGGAYRKIGGEGLTIKDGRYIATAAYTRMVADKVKEITGDNWQPSEVQETVWSWAKTLYELREKSKGKSTIELIKEGRLTDELIAAVPTFHNLLSESQYAKILREAGREPPARQDIRDPERQAEGSRQRARREEAQVPSEAIVRAAERIEKRYLGSRTGEGNKAGVATKPRQDKEDRRGAEEDASGRTVLAPKSEAVVLAPKKADGAVEIDGVHFSHQKLTSVDPSKFGTGIKGDERERLQLAPSEIKRRAYFYIAKPGEVFRKREHGLGPHAHYAKLGNLYEPGVSPPVEFDRSGPPNEVPNRFEKAILDAGYDGYINRDLGIAVVFRGPIQVKYIGTEVEGKVWQEPKLSRVTDSESFKKWFGKSKVVDKDGNPLVVYRGDRQEFESYDREGGYARSFPLIFFAQDIERAQYYGTPRPFYLRMEKPLDLTGRLHLKYEDDRKIREIIDEIYKTYFDGRTNEDGEPYTVSDVIDQLAAGNLWYYDTPGRGPWKTLQELVIDHGYDGLIAMDGGDGEAGISYAVVKPNQIKAVDNVGTFSRKDNRVRFSNIDPEEFEFDDVEYQDDEIDRITADLDAAVTLADRIGDDVANFQAQYKRDKNTLRKLGEQWLGISRSDGIFFYPLSFASDMQEIANEMSDGIVTVKKAKVTKDDQRYTAGFNPTGKYVLTLPTGHRAMVFENGKNEVILNVNALEQGKTPGSLIYQIVGTWAANNEKVFIGDPAGISDRALFRRAVNMFASALRAGGTAHLMPHPMQRRAGLQWVKGDDAFNVGSMAAWIHDTMAIYAPGAYHASPAYRNRRPGNFKPDAKVAPATVVGGPRTLRQVHVTASFLREIAGEASGVPQDVAGMGRNLYADYSNSRALVDQEGSAYKQNKIVYSNVSPYFYSELSRAVKRGPEIAPAQQWLSFIRNRPKVTKDELQWSGIEEYLTINRDKKLSRDEIVEFINKNGIVVRERFFAGAKANYKEYAIPGGSKYKELLITIPRKIAWNKGIIIRTSEHWNVDDAVVAHARFDSRRVDGQDILYVHEVQSDWAQHARRFGFANLSEEEKKLPASELIHQGIIELPHAMPRGPFVSTTEGWVNLIVKRLLVYAAENGYHAVVFDNGTNITQVSAPYKAVHGYVSLVMDQDDKHIYAVYKDLSQPSKIKRLIGSTEEALAEALPFYDKEGVSSLFRTLKNNPGLPVPVETDVAIVSLGIQTFYSKVLKNIVRNLAKKLDLPFAENMDIKLINLKIPKYNFSPRNAAFYGIPLDEKERKQIVGVKLPLFSRIHSPANIQSESFLKKAQRHLQDDLVRLRDIQGMIKKRGGYLTDENDAYLAAERMPGRIIHRVEAFEENELKPMLETLALNDIDLNEFALYAYAKHAPERNAYIESINEKIGDAGSGMSNEDAEEILRRFKEEGKIEGLERAHSQLMEITRNTRQLLLEYGLISREQFDAISSQYKNWVPLRGFEVEVDETGTIVSRGRGFRISGKEMIRAMGRTSRAGQIIENIVLDRLRTIERGEKNLVGKRFLDFVIDNPDKELWEVDATVKKPKIVHTSSGDKVVYYSAPETGENVFVTKVSGVEVRITIKDRPLAESMNKIGQHQSLGWVMDAMNTYNRWVSRLYTGLSPFFLILNAVRDFETAAVQGLRFGTGITLGIIKDWPAAVLAGIRRYYRGRTLDKALRVGDWERWDKLLEEYSRLGGRTGFMDLRTLEDIKNKIHGDLAIVGGKHENWFYRGSAYLVRLAELMEGINNGVEVGARLAAYDAALKKGMSKTQAISVGKNITVNFNRRGQSIHMLQPWFLFINPAIQGTYILYKALQNPKVQAVAAALVGSAIALSFWNVQAGGEDEDGIPFWDKIPTHVKDRNLIIMLPPGEYKLPGVDEVGKQGRYIKIPLPYGISVFASTGNAISDLWRYSVDKSQGKPPAKVLKNMVVATATSWNPLGGESPMTSVAPIIQPFMQHYFGYGRFGEPLYPQNRDGRPPSELVWPEQIGSFSHKLARLLNTATGGDEFEAGLISIPPPVLANYAAHYLGGPGMFIDRALISPIMQLETKGEVRPEQIPFVHQVYGTVSTREYARMYRELSKEAKEAFERFKKRAIAGKDSPVDEELLAALGDASMKFDRALGKLRQYQIHVMNDESLSREERIRMLNTIELNRRQLYSDWLRSWKEVQSQR